MEKEDRRRRRDLALGAYLVFSMHLLGSVAASAPPESHCTRWCGDIHIPYPFGIEAGCYYAAAAGFNLTCKNSLHEHNKKLLFLGDGTVQVLEISLPLGTVRINSSRMDATWSGVGAGATWNGTWGSGLPPGGPFFLSESTRNSVVLVGCNVRLDLLDLSGGDLLGSCTAMCHMPSAPPPPVTSPPAPAPIANVQISNILDKDCGGVGCCYEHVIWGYSSYDIQVHQLYNDNKFPFGSSVYIADDGNFSYYTSILDEGSPLPGAVPATLDWVINYTSSCPVRGTAPECRSAHSNCTNTTALSHPGYLCNCSQGYHGNPYVPDGCKDIDECKHKEAYSCYGTCQNFPGSFHCQCPEGTYGNSSVKGGCITVKNSFIGLGIKFGAGGGITLLLLALSGPFIMSKIKQQRVKRIFFKQNHGLLLQQLISKNANISERMIITLRQLELATDNARSSYAIYTMY